MAKNRQWKSVTPFYLLRVDPFYNKKISDARYDGLVPSEKTFFKEKDGLFVKPSSEEARRRDKEIRDRIKGHIDNQIICIKGYAGCGKSIYVQKLMFDFFPKANSFKNNTYNLKFRHVKRDSVHQLDIGAGTSRDDIKYRYIDGLSRLISNSIAEDRSIFTFFREMIIDNDNAIKHIDNKLIIKKEFIESSSIFDGISSNTDVLRKTLRNELETYDMSILFAIDCLWRMAMHAVYKRNHPRSDRKSMFIIAFDNLDAIDDIDQSREFIRALCRFRTNLDECQYYLHQNQKKYHISTFTFIVTCRNVTWGRLRLSEYADDDDDGTITSNLYDVDISKFFEYTEIVEKRIDYYTILAGTNKDAENIIADMNFIKEFNRMRYVRERFKPLFNYNYRKCIEVITECINNDYSYMKEAISLSRKHDLFSRDDAVYSGSSSVFFRCVFDYLKDHNLYDSSIMDLVDLNQRYSNNADNKQLTSIARVVLTYIYNECKAHSTGRTRTDQILEYFDGVYTPEDICHTLLALFERNSAWRRPINFSSRPLREFYEKEDLEHQIQLYKQHLRDNPEEFTKFEICKAGEEYIEFIIAHFEFYASRIACEQYPIPPLFSTNSLKYCVSEGKYYFEIACEEVLSAVKECCIKLTKFNKNVLSAKELGEDDYLLEPIIKRTGRNNPQLHEERVIFCHIYFLESYREYVINTYRYLDPSIPRNLFNRKMVAFITQYLDLYDEYVFSKRRYQITQELRQKIRKIDQSRYNDIETKIECETYNK